MKCERCKWDVSDVADFCPNCGMQFVDERGHVILATKGEVRDTDGWAVAAFIFSLLFFIPLAILLVIPCAIVSFIRHRKHRKEQGQGLAAAALVIGALVFILQAGIATVGYGVYYASTRPPSPAGGGGGPAISSMGQAVRANVEMVHMDMMALRSALSLYYADYAVYPPPTEDYRFPREAFKLLQAEAQNSGNMYMGSALQYYAPYENLHYNSDEESWYLVVHDLHKTSLDIDLSQYEGDPATYPGRDLIYDPTNGMESRGHVWMSGPDGWNENPLRLPSWMTAPMPVYSATTTSATY